MAQQQKADLSAELDRARARVSRYFGELREDLNVPAHLKSSIRRNKSAWLGGAALLGLLLPNLPARKKKIYIEKGTNKRVRDVEKAGMALGIAKLAFSAIKPAITAFATKKVAEAVTRRRS